MSPMSLSSTLTTVYSVVVDAACGHVVLLLTFRHMRPIQPQERKRNDPSTSFGGSSGLVGWWRSLPHCSLGFQIVILAFDLTLSMLVL
jgi:hypothetical protein